MKNENYLKSSLQKLNDIFNKRYGCNIDYLSPVSAHSTLNVNINSTDENVFQSSQPIIKADEVFLPLFVNNCFAGVARIRNSQMLQPESTNYIFQFVSSVMEQRLEQINLDLIYSDEPNDSTDQDNVIPLRPRITSRFNLAKTQVQNPSFSFSFLIEGTVSEDISKMALEIHHRSGRMAFLRIEDLSEDSFSNVDAINNLGNITIFAQEITSLPHALQRKLMLYFESPRDKYSPCFIAGTTSNYQSLRNDIRVYNALIPALSVGYLRMTQPFAFYRREGLLEFFFESLTGRNSM